MKLNGSFCDGYSYIERQYYLNKIILLYNDLIGKILMSYLSAIFN